jgi:hypothetical protein
MEEDPNAHVVTIGPHHHQESEKNLKNLHNKKTSTKYQSKNQQM